MRKVLFILFIGCCIGACRNESDVEPANQSTFVRYLGTENNNVALLAQEVNNGFTLLSYSEVATSTVGRVVYKTKLTRTDMLGNIQWDKNYPSFEGDNSERSMFPSAILTLPNSGYLILVDSINTVTDEVVKLQLLTINPNGDLESITTIPQSNPSLTLSGRALIHVPQSASQPEGYAVLAEVNNDPLHDMELIKLNANLSVNWRHAYGQGETELVNRLFLTPEKNYLWGGTADQINESVVLVKVTEDNASPLYSSSLTPTGRREVIYDFCETVGGWALTGSFVNAAGNEDVFIRKISNVNITTPTLFEVTLDNAALNDQGMSIINATDGGLVVAATVGTVAKEEDIALIKVDGFGNRVWTQLYGNSNKQEAASIRATSDGGYLVFGTTYFGNVKKLMLVKTNRDGKL